MSVKNTPKVTLDELRSQRWFKPHTIRAFAHRQRLAQIGWRREDFMNKPVIAIINTWSDLSPCHSHLRQRAEEVKRGIWQAGGFPVELPALSVGEVMVKPTTMLYRNFLAMEVEELLRSHPVDGAVLLGGCDKSTPGLLMGAFSVDLPIIFCPAGPMSNGQWRGQKTGAGTHTKKYWDELRLGAITEHDWVELESAMTRSIGTCNTMGTASTMTSIADILGVTIPGGCTIPAADANHVRLATQCGVEIINAVWQDKRPSTYITKENFKNAIVAYLALGGSTNAAIHIIAMANRLKIRLTLEEIAEIAKKIPVLANIFPAGNALMEDFHFAGGLYGLMKNLTEFVNLDTEHVLGRTLGEEIAKAKILDNEIIRPLTNPVITLDKGSTLTLLKGNLCPDGAVMKSSSAQPHLRKHTGPALVFDDHATLSAMIDDPNLEVTADTVLILRNAGPVGAPGMPEWGNLPIPKKLLQQGVTDMIRITDCRMSGTHYGSCILHVAPEAAIGGPLALVQNGDLIEVDIDAGTLNMKVDDKTLAERKSQWKPVKPRATRSYQALYQQHVTQANLGCDFDFLSAEGDISEPDIF
ncbi:IlvD/Edd family dehydratase [Thorsellia kenyensis]|uniref:IlvD/Edd family dehydratase n=1 Tax=Thorsellia kenyensis TaxID=1549888 RepID=A0ABV6CD29_9GAMM